MRAANLYAFGNCGFFKEFAGVKKMFYFAENPGIPDGCAANHHAINAEFHAPGGCFLWRIDVTITKNGDINSRISFDLAYQSPVGNAFIHLRTGAAVNS